METAGDWDGLIMLAVLAISPATLAGAGVAFRRACLPRGEGSLLTGAAAFMLGVLSGAVLLWVLTLRASAAPVRDPWHFVLWGPLREEVLKACLLLPFVLSRRLTDVRHGLWLGAAVGLGFAVFENHSAFMATDSLDRFLRVAGERTLLSPLHGLTTAIVGAAVGAAVSTGRWRGVAPAFLLGLGIHMGFNAATEVPDAAILPLIRFFHVRGADVPEVWSLLMGLPLLLAVIALLRFAWARRARPAR